MLPWSLRNWAAISKCAQLALARTIGDVLAHWRFRTDAGMAERMLGRVLAPWAIMIGNQTSRRRRTAKLSSTVRRKRKLDGVATTSRHSVAAYMTVSPHSIGRDQSLQTAHDMMRLHDIRHLPVLEYGRLAGILSQRDLYMIESFPGVIVRDTRVEEAMSEDTYCVRPDARVEEVAREMAENKYGCAVVLSGANVCGIFTTTDALRALSALLRLRESEGRVPSTRASLP